MTRAEILALVRRLDPGAEIVTTGDAHCVVVSAAMTSDGVDELLRAAPGVQVAFPAGTLLYDDMVEAMQTQDTSRLPRAMRAAGSYELDDVAEDGSWKADRPPAGWGTLQ